MKTPRKQQVTQAQFAKLADVHASTVLRWQESGLVPRAKTFDPVAAALALWRHERDRPDRLNDEEKQERIRKLKLANDAVERELVSWSEVRALLLTARGIMVDQLVRRFVRELPARLAVMNSVPEIRELTKAEITELVEAIRGDAENRFNFKAAEAET